MDRCRLVASPANSKRGAEPAEPWRPARPPHRAIGARRAAFMMAALSAALWTAPVRATDYYVDAANPSCSDAGPGSSTAPYCSIGAALAAHHDPGTTLHVRPGVYREQVTFPASGAAGSPIVIVADDTGTERVVVDGSDDFSSPALWVQSSGDVWRAASVSWPPRQVFADGARLTPSTAAPATLPARSFTWVSGEGLYVNAGGGSPAGHGALVGHRAFGFLASAKAWIAIRGFAVAHCEDRGIQLASACTDAEVIGNTVRFAGRYGINLTGGSSIRVAANRVFDSGDHGIALTSGATGCTIEDNEAARSVFASAREANGLYLFGCPGNTIRRNRWHHNQDSGEQLQSSSNQNVSIENLSWSNGDHGYDHLASTGTVHIGDVAWGNFNDGFSIEGNATGCQLFDVIAVDNGLTTNEYDLWVDANSAAGFTSNDNLFWNSTAQPPVKVGTTIYARVADYSAATGQDTRTVQADPRFVAPAGGDFHLRAGSPAIDDANSGVAGWPDRDAEGHARVDDPSTPNTGRGPVLYADRGALEFVSVVTNQPPVARLTVTPSSGTAPLAVRADASASSDPDGRIVSYRFDFGDGTVVGPQAGATAAHTYGAGHWTARVVVTDDGGATGSASATVDVTAAAANLCGNPSFESNTAGWAAVGGATIQRVSGGYDGAFSLLVSPPLLGLDAFGVTDSPDWVSATPGSGIRYRFSAWVRSDAAVGRVRLRVRELNGALTGAWVESSAITLLSAWQQLQVEIVTQQAGSALDMEVVSDPAVVTQAFRLDEVVIAIATGGAMVAAVPEGTGLAPPDLLPNPVADAARLSFETAAEGPAVVVIYDLAGRRVRRLLDDPRLNAGRHELAFDARGDDGQRLAPGIYYYTVRAPSGGGRGRFVVVR